MEISDVSILTNARNHWWICSTIFDGRKGTNWRRCCNCFGSNYLERLRRKHVELEITHWQTFGLQYTDPDEVETRRRLSAFYAADIDGNGELNVEQYLSAMDALGYTPDAERELRVVFDEADTDGNVIIDINEFLVSVAKHESND